jgi:predicted  nucleic acid-binding Zn-ribbon protein
MPTIDTIKVSFEADWTGTNAVNKMEADLRKVEKAASSISKTYAEAFKDDPFAKFSTGGASRAIVEYQRLEAQVKAIKNEMRGLGEAVNSGSMTMGNATARYQELSGALGQLEPAMGSIRAELNGVEEAAHQQSMTLGEMMSTYRRVIFFATAVAISLKGIQAALEKTYELAKAGAGITQLGNSFEFLTDNLLGVPGLLDKMRVASLNTISDLQLMQSFMTLVAGTSEDFGRKLAQQAPALLEVAKAANALNPTLGDTAFFFDSLARGIKRSEIRLLDNLGLVVKVGQANDTYASQLGKSVDALTAEERQIALLNETLRVGGQLMDQVAGKTSSLVDPYDQLSASAENLTSHWKEIVAVGMEGFIEQLSTNFQSFAINAAEAAEALGMVRDTIASLSGQSPEKAIVSLATLFDQTSPTQFSQRKEISRGIEDVVATYVAGSKDIVEAQARAAELVERGIGGNYSRNALGFGQDLIEVEINGELQRIVIDMETIALRYENAARQLAAVRRVNLDDYTTNPRQRRAAERPRGIDSGPSDEQLLDERRAAFAALQAQQARELQGTYAMASMKAKALQAANEKIAEAVKEQQEIVEAFFAAQDELRRGAFNDIFDDGESDLIVGSVKNLGQAFVTTTNATDDQKKALAAWKDEYESAADAVWDLENGIGTFGQEQEKLSEKLADARGEMEHYKALIDGVEGKIETSTRAITRYIDIDDSNAFRGVIEALEAAGGSADQIIGTAEAFGLIEPAAAEAARAVGLLQTAIALVGQQLADGLIDPAAAKSAIDGVIAELESGKTVAQMEIEVEVAVKTNALQESISKGLNLPDGSTELLPVGADITPAQNVIGQLKGIISAPVSDGTRVKIGADMSPAREEYEAFTGEVRSDEISATISIAVDDSQYQAWKSQNSGGGAPSPVPDSIPWFHSGGFITGNRGGDIPAVLQAGEYVIQRSAVNRLGTDFLDRLNRAGGSSYNNTSNVITIQFNTYGQQGGSQQQPVVVKTDDPIRTLTRVLRENGMRIG